MGSIENLEEIAKFHEQHKLLNPDVFGFNDSGEKFPIKLKMSMRAMLWLKDDYPETAPFIKEDSDGNWVLAVEVNNMDPVNRIVRSMPGEVEIIVK